MRYNICYYIVIAFAKLIAYYLYSMAPAILREIITRGHVFGYITMHYFETNDFIFI